MIAYAGEAAHIVESKRWLAKIESAILFPIMALMMSVAFFVFVWGAYEYILGANDESERAKGRSHMMYGIIGLLVMVSAMALLKIAAGTFGVAVPD